MAIRLAVIDPSLTSATDLQLMLSLDPSLQLLILDPAATSSPLQQIQAVLAGQPGTIQTLDLFCPAAPGVLSLGGQLIDSTALASDPALLADLNSLSALMAPGSSLMLYGNQVAQGAAGQSLIDTLASVGGFGIAASTDLTGASALGGNWSLEATSAGAAINAAPLVLDAVPVLLDTLGNAAPALVGPVIPTLAGTEDTVRLITSAELLQGWGDANGGALQVSSLNASSGLLTDNLDSTWTWQPPANLNGTVRLDYTVLDGQGGHSPAALDLQLAAVNDAPTLQPLSPVADGLAWQQSLADVNGDGYADALITGWDALAGWNTTVHAGTAQGFAATPQPLTQPSGFEPYATLAGDLNHDGAAEIVSWGWDARQGGYALTTTDKNLNASAPMASEVTNPANLLLVDLDGNGCADLITAGSGWNPLSGQFGSPVSVRLGSPTGLGPATLLGSTDGLDVGSLHAGDLNGDGLTDLVMRGTDLYGAGFATVVQLGGSATFNSVGTDSWDASAAIADLNGDGRADLILTGLDTSTGQWGVAVEYGGQYGGQGGGPISALGALTRVTDAPASAIVGQQWQASNSVVIDWNQDGHADLLTRWSEVGLGSEARITIQTGQVGGGLDAAQTLFSTASSGLPWAGWDSPQSLQVGDVNRDGHPDLLVSGWTTPASTVLVSGQGLPVGTEDMPQRLSQADLLAGWVDVDGDAMTATHLHPATGSGTVLDNGDGSFSFLPTPNLNGDVLFSYDVIDGQGGLTPATIGLHLNPINDPPALTGIAAVLPQGLSGETRLITTTELLQGWSDVEGSPLSVTALQASAGTLTDLGTVNGVPSWSLSTPVGFAGPLTLSYSVSDGQGGLSPTALGFDVINPNHPPVLSATPATLPDGVEDTPIRLTAGELLTGWTDPDGQPLSVLGASGPGGQISANPDGSWTFTPTANLNGALTVDYQVSDGLGGVVPAHLNLNLAAVNDTPAQIGAPAVLPTTITDAPIVLSSTDLLAGWVDVDGDAMTVTALTSTQGWTWDNFDGTWSFLPDPAVASGTLQLGVEVSDGQGGLGTGSISLNLIGPNRAPVLSTTPAALPDGTEDIAYRLTPADLLQGWSDPEGAALSVLNLACSSGSLSPNPDGSWTYLPVADFNGLVSFSYQVSDGQGGLSAATIDLNLIAVNDAPRLAQTLPSSTALDAAQGWAFSLTLPTGLFIDIDSPHLTLYATQADGSPLPTWLSFDAASQTFSGTPTGLSTDTQLALQVHAFDGQLDTAAPLTLRLLAGGLVTLTAVDDVYVGTIADETILGLAGNDRIDAGAGHDTLDGGLGADTLIGGTGNDTYLIDNPGDVVVELLGQGLDTVRSSISYGLGSDVENLVLTGVTAIDGTGNALDNALAGNAAANRLDGGAGADTMSGGGGNDTYFVDSAGDVVIEAAAQGTDTVLTSVSFTLPANVEILTLTGTAAIDATGNAIGNLITGNAAANLIDGGAGIDRMIGGAGNDTYRVDHLADQVVEATTPGEIDTVISTVSGYALPANVEQLQLEGPAISGRGHAQDNLMQANPVLGSTLDGGLGADTLIGGAGNDFFVVDNAADVAIDRTGGIDTVQSSIDWALSNDPGNGLDNLVLTGTALRGTGNALNNTLSGNAAANWLDGGIGVDTMSGGGGNDTYLVDSAGDVVIEAAAQGTDTVLASVSFTLPAEVEVLTLTGSAPISGAGNAAANQITGNAGANALGGGAGADWLTGGLGADAFIFNTPADPTAFDVITDFQPGIDHIVLDAAVFPGLMAGQSAAADRIRFDPVTQMLGYDPDGAGLAPIIPLATLLGQGSLNIATDLIVIDSRLPLTPVDPATALPLV